MGCVRVVERLGKFHSVLPPGIHFVLWPVDEVRQIHWRYTVEEHAAAGVQYRDVDEVTTDIRTASRTFDLVPTQAFTLDPLQVSVNILMTFRIVDPKRAVYAVQDLMNSLERFVQSAVRETTALMTYKQLSTEHAKVRHGVKSAIEAVQEKWGVKIDELRLQGVVPSKEVLKQAEESTRQQMEFQRRRMREEDERASRTMEQNLKLELKTQEAEHELDVKKMQLEGRRRTDEVELEARRNTAEVEAGRIKALMVSGMTLDYFAAEQWSRALTNLPANLATLIVPSIGSQGASTANVKVTKIV